MSDTGSMLTAIHTLIAFRHGVPIPDGVDRGFLVMQELVDGDGSADRITARGEAWLAMIEATPLPVQQWIDPRAKLPDLGEFRGFVESSAIKANTADMIASLKRDSAANAPQLPELPDGFIGWAGQLGTVFDKELGANVKVTVPNGIGVDRNVVVFQRNGKIRTVQGQQQFPAGAINWEWAKEPDPANIPPGQEKKAADRFKRQQAEDVIGYAVIAGQDDHLRRDL